MKPLAKLIAYLQSLPEDTIPEALTRVMIDGSEEFEFKPVDFNVNVCNFGGLGGHYLQLGEHSRSCRELSEEEED